MVPRRLAAIDVGTNTTLLLVAEIDGDEVRVLAERAEITRLGRGIGVGGDLRAENVQQTLDALREYAVIARQHGAPIRAVGTEGLRRAGNAPTFLEPAAQILGVPVEVIDGVREAELTFLATQRSFPALAAGTMSVVDIGGGSTEFILCEGGRVTYRESLPLGSVRLHEAFLRGDPPDLQSCHDLIAHVAAALAVVPFQPGAALVGTAGTVTTLAAMALQLSTYNPAVVHGHHMSRAAVQTQVLRLQTTPEARRRDIVGLDPRRADVILAGALLLDTIAGAAGADAIVVSDRGVRWGLVFTPPA